MGESFWDNFTTTSGLNFIGKEEKDVMVEETVPFKIERIFHTPSKFGPRYVAITNVDGEERALGFGAGTVESRDQFFDALIGWYEREDAEPVTVVMKRAGNAILVLRAETDEEEVAA